MKKQDLKEAIKAVLLGEDWNDKNSKRVDKVYLDHWDNSCCLLRGTDDILLFRSSSARIKNVTEAYHYLKLCLKKYKPHGSISIKYEDSSWSFVSNINKVFENWTPKDGVLKIMWEFESTPILKKQDKKIKSIVMVDFFCTIYYERDKDIPARTLRFEKLASKFDPDKKRDMKFTDITLSDLKKIKCMDYIQ